MANESATAERFIKEVLSYCINFKQVIFYAVIDNVSKDDTRSILNALQEKENSLKVIFAPENKNVVDAYVRGYREALNDQCDWILEIDAGYSHLPSEIPLFFEKLSEGYDCVFGSRFIKGGKMVDSSLIRYTLSKGGTLLINLFLGTKLRDMTSGFELFSHKALTHVLKTGINSKGHFFQTEIKTFCRHFKIVEVPIHYTSPSPGLRFSVITDAFKNLFLLVKKSGYMQTEQS
jgi:dolichol-phosphate mannosyltransferase